MVPAKNFFLALLGFSAGLAIAGGIFAFIAAIGLVPRVAQRTKTIKHIPFYEDAITLGGIFGTSTMLFEYYIPIGNILTAFFSLLIGAFIGCLAVSLAEVINVMPVFMRRARIKIGIPFLVLAFALGKVIGSLVYLFIPGFYLGF